MGIKKEYPYIFLSSIQLIDRLVCKLEKWKNKKGKDLLPMVNSGII
jgi:hypothetical protein